MATKEQIEAGAAGMYGKNWNSPDPERRPGEKMKDVWRKYAKDCLEAAEADLKDKAETVVFHYFNCNDGDGEGCGRLRPTMAELARAIGYDAPSVNDEIAEALSTHGGSDRG